MFISRLKQINQHFEQVGVLFARCILHIRNINIVDIALGIWVS